MLVKCSLFALYSVQFAAKDIRKAQKALGHKSIEVTARHYVLGELER